MIEIWMLRHFVAVVELGSFTRASQQLNASQSVVSRSIKRLEAAVGAPLLERTTRNVKLSEAGEAYYREARAIVDRLAVATENARRIFLGSEATVRVAVCPSVDARSVAMGLQAFRERWPKVEVQLTPTYSNAQADALRRADLDVGVMRMHPSVGLDLERRIITRDELMVAVPSVWNLGKTRIRLEELRDRPWIFPEPAQAGQTYERLLGLCRSAGFEPNIVAVVGDPVSSKLLLACGVGAAFSPGRNATSSDDGSELLALDGLPEPFVTETAVVWAAGSNSVHVQDFVRCVLGSGVPADPQGRVEPRSSAC